MDNLPRLSFYLSGILITSTGFTLLTTDFLPLLAQPGFSGTLVLLLFGVVYMNIVFVISRRFMRRLQGPTNVPYIFAFLVAIVPIFWIFIYDAGLMDTMRYMFAGLMTFASFLGAFFGHRAGLKAQIKFQQQVLEYLRKSGQLPEEFETLSENSETK